MTFEQAILRVMDILLEMLALFTVRCDPNYEGPILSTFEELDDDTRLCRLVKCRDTIESIRLSIKNWSYIKYASEQWRTISMQIHYRSEGVCEIEEVMCRHKRKYSSIPEPILKSYQVIRDAYFIVDTIISSYNQYHKDSFVGMRIPSITVLDKSE